MDETFPPDSKNTRLNTNMSYSSAQTYSLHSFSFDVILVYVLFVAVCVLCLPNLVEGESASNCQWVSYVRNVYCIEYVCILWATLHESQYNHHEQWAAAAAATLFMCRAVATTVPRAWGDVPSCIPFKNGSIEFNVSTRCVQKSLPVLSIVVTSSHVVFFFS